MTIELIAACAFGLEAIVRRELAALGYSARVVSPGRLLFEGDAAAICRTNLWLRCADRVLIRVASFPAADFDALFDTTRELDWAQWLPRDASFPVNGRSIKSQLTSVPAIQRTVKKAIVLSMQKAYASDTLAETGAEYKVEISLLGDEATLTIDTTGPSLHRRGYRTRAGGAPLKETLAAALVSLSFWNRDRPLIDPFCGSGTIPIEAAMIGRNLAPGRHRSFAAQQWPVLPMDLWSQAVAEAADLQQPQLEQRILGTDVDERTLAGARANAVDAEVDESIHFQMKPFAELSSSRKHGCLITNPPYGERLGERSEWEPLYTSMPLVLRGLPTWSHYVLTAYPGFERLVGRTADRRRKLYNGRIECTYFQFHGPKAGSANTESQTPAASASESDEQSTQSPITSAFRLPKQSNQAVFGALSAKAREQAELFKSRLTKRARHLRRYPTRQGITCYRIYERDIPEIPLIVDRYEDHLHIVEYDRPHERDPAEHANWLDLMVKTAAEALEIGRGKTFFKHKRRQTGSAQHEHVASERYEIEVTEGGQRFLVNLSDYVDTGLFLDHRITRGMVRDESKGKSLLNLFAYTGSFSVYAAAGGATRTTTVDWSNTYLDWARRNMTLNGFDGPEHQFLRGSAVDYVTAHPKVQAYDIAVIDPPTFSNSKRTDDVWDVGSDHADLINGVIDLMNPGGVIYFSSNFRRLKFDSDAIRAEQIREISAQTVPPEYRNRRIHRCWRIQVSRHDLTQRQMYVGQSLPI